MDRALVAHGMTNAQYGVLASLRLLASTGARPSQRELADFSGLEPMYVSKLVRGLEGAGLLERQANEADPRAVQLVLTEEGERTVVDAAATVRELHDQLLEPFGGLRSERSQEFAEDLQVLLSHVNDSRRRS